MLPLILAVLQSVTVTVTSAPSPDTTLAPADSAAMATAYLDDGARELVRSARTHRGVIDASVFRYTATGRQRLSVGLRALRRDRLVYRRESATLLDWRRDGPSRIEVVGAREAVPIAIPGVRVPDDLESWALEFLPRPGDPRLFVDPGGGGFAWHPLVEGGEALYRYASGDTTVIRLPDGRTITLIELRVTPRERDIRVVAGSFWIETENHAIVQAVFRPSRDFDLDRDLPGMDPDGSDSASEVPRILKPIRFDVRYMTVEYGLWEMQWWMPRVLALDGSLQVGIARFPFRIESTFEDYTVEPDRYGLPELPPVTLRMAGDPFARPRTHRYPTSVVVADSASLLDSPLLPPSLFASGAQLVSESEMRQLAERLGAIPRPPWEAGSVSVTWPWEPGHGLLRYNRIEGLSVGARAEWDVTRVRLDLTARVGIADPEPDVELGVWVPGLRRSWRTAAYHRLASADPGTSPFGIQNSVSALVLGRDEGLYFRATGGEVLIEPALGERRYDVRFYVERQAGVQAATDFSLRRVLDSDHRFESNLAADPATQAGLAVSAVTDALTDPGSFRWSARADLKAETGTYTFARPGIGLSAGVPLPAALSAAAEVGAGTTVGASREDRAMSPTQSLWLLGGPATLRGFPAGALAGPDHVRGRLEVANRFPAARVVLFSDAGWAGSFDELRSRDLAVSAGAGVSLLDGILRLDVARAIRPDRAWRAHLYIDALL